MAGISLAAAFCGGRVVATKQHWAIQFSSGKDRFLIGVPWVGTASPHGLRWPAVFSSRREARHMAKTLTGKFMYLRPWHVWKFYVKRIVVTVAEGK